MARRNDHKSIQHGSDALFDVTCTPCGEDGLQEEAVKYCPECHEYLCTSCTKCHQRMKATRGHKLTGARQAKQNPVVVKKALTEKCWYHPDRNIEMYCRTHDMVYCTRCIATEHRTCSGVTDVDHAAKENASQHDLQRLQTETDEVYGQLIAIKLEKEKRLEAAEEKQTKTLGRIKEIEREMVEHIEKVGKKAIDALKEKYAEVKNELETSKSKINQMTGKVGERKGKLEEAVGMDDVEKFVQVKLSKKAKDDAKKLYKEIDSESSRDIQFTENKQFMDVVMKTESFGDIVKVKEQKKLQVRKVDIEAKDEFCCLIADLCQLPDGRIILVDQRNRKLKVLNEKYMVDTFWKIDVGEPTGICCLGENEVAVKFRSDKVMFYSVADSYLRMSRECICIEDGGSWGLSYFAGDLWMSYRDGFRVYSTTGALKEDISCILDENEDDILCSPVHHSVRKNSIFLANGDEGVVCLDKNGSLKYELQDERLDVTRGVCVTSHGTVFVSGFMSNNVVMFNKDGKCLGEIVTDDMMPQNGPGALLYDYRKNCLLMTCSNSNSIIVVD